MQFRRTNSIAGRKDGIALVIVLGFLSLLVIMAVGFTISMRVERLAARNAVDIVRARQLGVAALTRAVDDIYENLDGTMGPDWDGDWIDGAFESIGAGIKATNGGSMYSGYITNYIPAFHKTAAINAADAAEWVNIEFTDSNTGKKTLIGRYAYVALDCSGFLDINMDYSTNNVDCSPRRWGTNINELVWAFTNALLTELTQGTSSDPRPATNIVWLRTNDIIAGSANERHFGRVETAAEIIPIFARWAQLPPFVHSSNAPNPNRHFMAYSRFPRGTQVGNTIVKPYYIGNLGVLASAANPYASTNFTALVGQLNDMGITDSEIMARNMLDYIDKDNVPRNQNSFCTEAVPMLNEIVVSNRIASYTDSTSGFTVYSNSYRISVEVFYPFMGKSNTNRYKVQISPEYLDAEPSALNIPAFTAVDSTAYVNGPWTQGMIRVVHIPTNGAKWVLYTNETGGAINPGNIKVRLRAVVLENDSSSPAVDQVGVSLPLTGRLNIPIGNVASLGSSFSLGSACNDPRINWDGGIITHWIPESGGINSLGSMNPEAKFMDAGSDLTNVMFVSNATNFYSVGEMGYLLYDATKHWQTIRLLDPVNMRVLDYFTMSNDENANDVDTGLININTKVTNVLASAFHQMITEPHRFASSNIVTTAELARVFASNIITSVSAAAPYDRLSDMGKWGPAINQAYGVHQNKFFKESVIRNSCNYFSPRQNLFTIMLAVQSTDNSTNILADLKGIALVWRDTYKIDGNHEMYIRNFRWLTE